MSEPNPSHSYDLFISYATTDRAWVGGFLLPALGLPAARVIVADAFTPGAPIASEFERAVTSSRYTLLVFTPDYLADQWGTFGDLLATQVSVTGEQDRVIPLVLIPCQLPLRAAFRVVLDCVSAANWDAEIERLRKLLALPVNATPGQPAEERIACPYPGMRPFTEADAAHFYGRDDEVADLLRRLRYNNFQFVIGPSGSGKSSLVFAGVLPELRRREPESWVFRSLRPGAAPMSALAAAVGDLVDLTTYRPLTLGSRSLLLIVDQFEEVFVQAPRSEQAAFITALKALRQVLGLTCILTLRADFYPDLMNSTLWPVDASQRLEIAPLRGDALRRAIQRPAADVGVYLELGLMDRLVADAADEPGALPLLQEALALLWQERVHRLLPLSAYERLGGKGQNGLAVALATHAEAVLAALPQSQNAIARRIFLRLVQFGEGRADTRRQQAVTELQSIPDDPARFDATLSHLVSHRLLTLSGEERGGGRRADIAHEALLNGWPRLSEWTKARRGAEESRRRLEVKAAEWIRLGRGEGGLLDATELHEAAAWLVGPDAAEVGYSADLLAFIELSRRTFNPGWHRRGLAILATGAIALAALLALFFVVSQSWPTVLQVGAWLSVAAALLVAGVGVLWPRRGDPYLIQRFSQWASGSQRRQAAIGGFVGLVVVLWAITGLRAVQIELYCGRSLGYTHPRGDAVHVAVLDQGARPFDALTVALLLSRTPPVSAWVVAPDDALRCAAFFTYRVDLQRLPASATEVSYTASLRPARGETAVPRSVSAVGPDSCAPVVGVAERLAPLVNDRVVLREFEGISPPPTGQCQPIILDVEGVSALEAKNYDKAGQAFTQAIALEPEYAVAHYNLGLVYLYTDRYAEARTSFERATALEPGAALFLNSLGVACYRLRDYGCAERSYQSAIASQPGEFDAYNNLAVLYREAGRTAEAATALDRAAGMLASLGNLPDLDRWRFQAILAKNRGILAFRMEQWIEAIRNLEQAEKLTQEFTEEIVYYLAFSYERAGDQRRACALWQRYVSLPRSGLYEEDRRRLDGQQHRQTLRCG